MIEENDIFVGSEVLTPVTDWDMTPCSPVEVCYVPGGAYCLLLSSHWLVSLFFDPEDGSSNFLRNIREVLPNYTASSPWRKYSSNLSVLKTVIKNVNGYDTF
jgi:hypothetical protein